MPADRMARSEAPVRRPAPVEAALRRPAAAPPAQGSPSRLAERSTAAPALETPVLAAPVLRGLERLFLALDRILGRALPDALNPFLHTGAVAMTSLVVALVTGVALLIWYRPSLHVAWTSVAGMAEQPWTAGVLRSLHRYSSDFAMLFALAHALRLFFERRFDGPRWLAWVTGGAVVGATWFVGWTGYWLVWDTRAHAVAEGTARVLDALPIFADPMGRSFLTDRSLNSLLFFVVFFAHMLVPLVMAILLWLHLTRTARPRWITRRPLTVWTLVALAGLSLLWPADIADPARMTALRRDFAMDWWYLAPVALTDRLAGGPLWAIALGIGVALGAVPWWMARRRRGAATIYPERCTACRQCSEDCPYGAIHMVPRTAGPGKYALQAEVDPGACVNCGICAASCDGFGTDLTWFSSVGEMRRLEGWVKAAVGAGEPPVVVFACAHAAGAGLAVDPDSGRCPELPGARVLGVPCAGWTHMTTVERMLRVGATRVAIVGCAPGACHFREGVEALRERVAGERHPHLRAERTPRERVHVLAMDRGRRGELASAIAALRGAPAPVPGTARPSRALAGAAATLLAVVVAWGVGRLSVAGYASPRVAGSQLVVTFKHPGRVSEESRALTEEEKARIPVHMRRDRAFKRERAAVRMRVSVDGRRMVDRAYPPKGLWHDGNSIAVETLPLAPGEHEIEVRIGDTRDPGEWTHRRTERLTFTPEARRVISFDRVDGFRAH